MITLVVQAGGESSRMGQDKALAPFLGVPLIQRVLTRVSHLADQVVVTTNNPAAYEFLEVPLVRDLLPGRGALGGLYTALDAASNPIVMVVACDMPFVNPDLLIAAHALLEKTRADAVIPQTRGGSEPFHAVYRRDTCLTALQAAIQADKWRVNSWFGAVKIRYMSETEIRALDPNGLAFWNVNTPAEFLQAERIALNEMEPHT